MDYSPLVLNSIITVPEVVSVIACLCFFWSYAKLPKQTLGFKMILTLCISDFIFHLFTLLFIWWEFEDTLQTVASTIMDLALRFSILWASCIAYLVLSAVQKDAMLNPQSYSKKSFVMILIACIILSAICEALEHDLIALILTMIIPLSLSLSFTAFCYLKSASILKNYPPLLQGSMQQRIKNMYLYSFVQLLTTGPIIFYAFFEDLLDTESEIWTTIVYFTLGLVGFVNSSVYFFQRRAAQKVAGLKEPAATSSSSFSNSKEVLMVENILDPPRLANI